MSDSFSLLTARWLPVRRARGTLDWISPAQLTSSNENGPIVAFAWPRPDFDLAAHEFLIGLLAVAFPPGGGRDWLTKFQEPPSEAALATAFAPFDEIFRLDGMGPRFLQDLSELEANAWPIEALFIEAPGANTIRLNKDLFVKRNRTNVLSRAGAAMALYTLQQFAPFGGAGHRTSLRGGGPLVTIAFPGAVEDAEMPTLWQKLWLNVPKGTLSESPQMKHVFPWLAPTRTSANKASVSVADAHPLQAFFGMPRRIRLVFEKNRRNTPCDLTGLVDKIVVTGLVSEPWGINYGVWRHPLTPYYQVKTDILPVHAAQGRIGYRQWLGLVYKSDAGMRLPAAIMNDARERLEELSDEAPHWKEYATILVGGYAMDKAKALAFTEAEMPMHLVGDEAFANELAKFASVLVQSAKIIDSLLIASVKIALFGDKAKADSSATPLDVPRERLWEDTEDEFHSLLDLAIAELRDDTEDKRRKALKERWRRSLERAALHIFDDVTPLNGFGDIEPKSIVDARRLLALGLRGYGAYGQLFFGELELTSPEAKLNGYGTSTRRTREETPV
jgi:CRISPR system Cascade subunit CasA